MPVAQHRIFQTIHLLSGVKIDVIMPTGWDYSKALHAHRKQDEIGMEMYLMEAFCLVDGEKKPMHYYGDMMCDDFIRLMEVVAALVTPNK